MFNWDIVIYLLAAIVDIEISLLAMIVANEINHLFLKLEETLIRSVILLSIVHSF